MAGSYIPLFGRRQSRDPGNSSAAMADDELEATFDDPSEDAEGYSFSSAPVSPDRHRSEYMAGTSHDSTRTQTDAAAPAIPGGYDFEPQVMDSTPTVSRPRLTPRRLRPTANSGRSPNRTYRNSVSFGERLIPAALYRRMIPLLENTRDENEHRELLFAQDGDESTDAESGYPPARATLASHGPLPAQPPVFAAPAQAGRRVFGGGQGNDGVFANLSAKPDGQRRGGGIDYVGGEDSYGDKDEVPPSYEAAAQDATPPYWETTIITPQGFLGPEDICVDGLPVGSFFGFAWNLLVSMSFQFVGFLLTYLLHTTHAAKNGSRAGLGITLIQFGFYLKQRTDNVDLLDGAPGDLTGLDGAIGPSDSHGWGWWGGSEPTSTVAEVATSTMSAFGSLPTQLTHLANALNASDPDATPMPTMPSLGNLSGADMMKLSSTTNEWMAFFLMIIGWFLLLGGCLNYWRAVRWARAVRAGMGPGADAETRIEA